MRMSRAQTGGAGKRWRVRGDAARARDPRRRAEETLRKSEEQLRLAIDTIPTLVWSCRPDGAFDYVSRRWSEYTGIPAEGALGSGWMAAYHPEDVGKHQQIRLAALVSGEPVVNEVRLRRADGQYRWHLIHGVPLRDETGKIVKWYGAATDIEDRKRIEQALRRSEAYLAEAQRLGHAGSWAIDYANRKPIHSSEEHHRLFAFDPAGGMPSWRDWMLRIHPDDRAMTREIIERSSREQTDFEMDYRICHPDGTIKYLHVLGHPVLDEAGAVVEFVGTSVDVTERRRAEEARQDAQNKLSHANRIATMGQLTASIAHEVNQPITGVVTNAEAALRFLAMQPVDLSEVRQSLADIVKGGNRAGEIVAGIRALINKAPPRNQPVNINEVVQEVIALTRSEMTRNRILLKVDLAEELPSVHGDQIQLQQVLLNLIMNAAEAMGADIDSSRELLIATSGEGRNSVRVAVADTGPGLRSEVLERLFDAFYTTKSGGMGMGLAICRSIVEAHGGRLWASPNTPRGAVFRFEVPARAARHSAPRPRRREALSKNR
jgi:PAS domain S-box-containing protein